MFVVRAVLVSALMLDAAIASAAQLTASWTDNSGGAASTQIDRKRQTDASFAPLGDVPPGITTYVDATVSEGVTYCYRVKAYNAFGESPYSETACATPTPTTYTLTIAKAGTGAGTVASNPTGISCGSDCNELYTAGAVVTLAATAAPSSRFDGWRGGGCSGTGSCTLSGNAAATVTATFTVVAAPAPAPAPTPTPTPTPPPVVSPTPTPTPTPVTSPTPTPTPTPVTSPTPTPTPTPVTSPTPTPTPTPVATTTTTTSDATPVTTTTTTTSTPQSLMTTVQSYVTTLAPYRVMAQLKDYLDPLFTPKAAAAPIPPPAPVASAPVIEPSPAPELPPAMTAMVLAPPAAARPVPPPRWTPPLPTDGRTTHRLVARVTERTWIKIRMDNGQVNRETVRPGAVRQWVSNGRFLVSVGNAGAVRFELDGRPVPALGERGASVSDVVLPPDPGK